MAGGISIPQALLTLNNVESIYNLLPSEPGVKPQSRRYQSIHRPMVRQEMMERKTGHRRTIGPAAVQKPDPNHFLRSHAALNLHKNANSQNNKHFCAGRRPPLPDLSLRPTFDRSNEVNIIRRNRLLALLSDAKNHTPAVVDSKFGHRYKLNGSGLTKQYLYKKDFGEPPAYMKRRREEKVESAKLYTQYQEEVALHRQVPRLSAREREDLLHSLKEKHSQLYAEFLRLSVIIDTLHKRQKKERLEKALKDLEKDIRTVEEHQFIHVEE